MRSNSIYVGLFLSLILTVNAARAMEDGGGHLTNDGEKCSYQLSSPKLIGYESSINKKQVQIVKVLNQEYPVLFAGPIFENAFKGIVPLKRVEKLSSQLKLKYAQQVWDKLISDYATNNITAAIWAGNAATLPPEMRENVNKVSELTVEELEVVCTNLKSINKDVRQREAAIALIASNIVPYTKRLERKKNVPAKVQFLGEKNKVKTLLKYSATSAAVGISGLYFTSNFWIAGVGLSIPWVYRGMKTFKSYLSYWRATRPGAPFVPQLGYLDEGSVITETEKSPQISIDELSEFKPNLNVLSVSSVETLGTEIEHGVRILGAITGQSTHNENREKRALANSIRDLLNADKLSWDNINEALGKPILTYQNRIGTDLDESQNILTYIDKMNAIFDEHIAYVHSKEEQHRSEFKIQPNVTDPVLGALALKAEELGNFKESLTQMRAIPETRLQKDSDMRRGLVSLVNKIALRVSLPSREASPDDVKSIRKLLESLDEI